MKFLPFVVLMLIIASCNKIYNAHISLFNPSDFDRQNELVVISADSLPGYIKKDNLLLTVEIDSIKLPSQCDDLDNDGKWDELAFMLSFKPKEKITVQIKSSGNSVEPYFDKKTNIRFAKLIKANQEYTVNQASGLKENISDSTIQDTWFESPAWENDKVAFRNYFSESHGIDILGKIRGKLILDSIGINKKYNSMQSWGMDILKTDNSFGAGSLALIHKDSLFILKSVIGAAYTKVATGSIRSIFDVDFNEITFKGQKIKIKHRISIVAGEYGYRSTVTTNNTNKELFVVTGFVNLNSSTLYFDSSDKNEIMFTHDNQSENKDRLGLGIIININDYKGFIELPNEITHNSNCIKLKTANETKTEFRVYAGWQLTEPAFAYRQNFRNYLLREAYKMDQPIHFLLPKVH